MPLLRSVLLAAFFSIASGATEECVSYQRDATGARKCRQSSESETTSRIEMSEASFGESTTMSCTESNPWPSPRPKRNMKTGIPMDEWNQRMSSRKARAAWIKEIQLQKTAQCPHWCCRMSRELTIAYGQMFGIKPCCGEDFFNNIHAILEPKWNSRYGDTQWTHLQLEIFQWLGANLSMSFALKLPKSYWIPKPCKGCAAKILDRVSAELGGTCPLPLLVNKFAAISKMRCKKVSMQLWQAKLTDLCETGERGWKDYSPEYCFPPTFFKKVRAAMDKDVLTYPISQRSFASPLDKDFCERANGIDRAHRVDLFKKLLQNHIEITPHDVKDMFVISKAKKGSNYLKGAMRNIGMPNDYSNREKLQSRGRVLSAKHTFQIEDNKDSWGELSQELTKLFRKYFCGSYKQSIEDGSLEVPEKQRAEFLRWLDET